MTEPAPEPVNPLRRSFRKALSTACKRSSRKEDKLKRELADCSRADELLECGEIIKANLNAIKRGDKEVTLGDLYHAGSTRTISLDPCLNPLANAKCYFKKHRKLVKGEERVRTDLSECQREGKRRKDMLDLYVAWESEAAPSEPPPAEMAEAGQKLRVHVEGVEKPGSDAGRASGVREFVSHDGLIIMVGKNSRDNDYLTTRRGKGNDWWLHVAHFTGSHVVVKPVERSVRRGERVETFLPQETLLDAAHLAVYYSKIRNTSKAEVHYTQVKHVRKRRGAPAGQVTLLEHKSLMIRIEPARLERLLRKSSEQL